jgi:hypothetical protein
MSDTVEYVKYTKVSELLTAAKAEIQKNGWCQGQYTDNKGQHCILGATMSQILDNNSVYWDAVKALQGSLGTSGTSGFNDVVVWNDDPSRTVDEVIALFDKAIERAKREELSEVAS